MPEPLNPRYGQIDAQYAAMLAAADDTEGPVWMVNLMAYRPRAEYADGRESTLTGRQADDRYTPIDELAKVGARIVFVGDVEDQLLGDAPRWDRVAVVKYPTRRAFIEMTSSSDYERAHAHKDAGMAQTFVIGCTPFAPPELPADAPDVGAVPFPSTPEDGPVVVVHVLKYKDADAYRDMEAYQMLAGSLAVPHGVRVHGWFDAEGTIVGDGRSWDQVRFNAFPSKAAFMAVVLDPERLRAQHEHRETAIADTYTMIVRPVIDELAASLPSLSS